MRREHFIKNMNGVLFYKDIPLFSFEIKDRQLISFQDLSNGEMWPYELRDIGVSYVAINNFFRRRVVADYAMWLREYLDALYLDHYDFEEIVKRMNGNNNVDFYWVKFDGIGAKQFSDIISQEYPIYKEGTI